MQTFLPYPSFYHSAIVLDYRRHGKQRVEAMQIHRALHDDGYGWQNHPAVKMWRGYEEALALYHNIMILTWKGKGYRNNMQLLPMVSPVVMPHWFGDEAFHRSHRSRLLQKDYDYYIKFWNEPLHLSYVWPGGN